MSRVTPVGFGVVAFVAALSLPWLPTARAQEKQVVAEAPNLLKSPPDQAAQPISNREVVKSDDGRPQVRLVGTKTDVAKRYRVIIPPLPIPPFSQWRQWFRDHEEAVHCALEWRNEKGEWVHGELRSTHFQENSEMFRVGYGEFPGTAYDAYGIYIIPGRIPRDKDKDGRPLEIAIDEEVKCDYREVEAEIRKYGAKDASPGSRGTGGSGKQNVGLGGPAYKPSQNSNTMVKFILRACGVNRKAPDLAVGWESEPHFPFSSNADAPAMDNQP